MTYMYIIMSNKTNNIGVLDNRGYYMISCLNVSYKPAKENDVTRDKVYSKCLILLFHYVCKNEIIDNSAYQYFWFIKLILLYHSGYNNTVYRGSLLYFVKLSLLSLLIFTSEDIVNY